MAQTINTLKLKKYMNEQEEQYKEFMRKYHQEHEVCPKCGSKKCITTLVGFILDLRKPEDYRDENQSTCLRCKNEHSVHERISKKEFRKISKTFPERQYVTDAFHNPKKECLKSFELLRRVYDIIETSHLNDGKLIPIYTKKFEFPRSLGDDIFNLLSSKDQLFRSIFIKRQKRYRRRLKNGKI